MLFLLRKIRRKLLEKNKFTTYLLYAIGEIVLVVIGILIAVQINDWKGNQIKIAKETELIAALEQELNNNIVLLEEALTKNNTYKKVSNTLLAEIEAGNTRFREIDISKTFDYLFFVIESPTLNDIILKNSDVLVNRKQMIQDFRTLANNYSRIASSSSYLDEFWNSQITPFYVSSGIFYQPFTNDVNPYVELAEINSAGYSMKQFQSLISLKMALQYSRELTMLEALHSSKETLLSIQSN